MFAKQRRKQSGRRPRYGGKQSHPSGLKSQRRPARSKPANDSDNASGVRLQKVLAAAGIGSRRQCEELIREGRVEVDGQTVSELGTRVDPQQQKIRVDGEVVHRPKRKLYYLINKPAGVLSTNNDPAGRPRVIDLAPSHQRLFTVGRLDQSSSGLILVTNDGALTDLLTHPRYGVEKAYVALVAGVPSSEAIAKLERGVHLAEGYAHAKRVLVRRSHRHSTLLEIVLDEGRNREVRRLLARIGHKVLSLRRVAMGPLRLGNLQPGESRPLRSDEVEELYEAARQGRKRSGKSAGKRSKTPGTGSSTTQQKQKSLGQRSAVEPIIDKSLSDADSDGHDLLPRDDEAVSTTPLPLLDTAAMFPSDAGDEDDDDFDDEEHADHDEAFDETLADDDWSGELASEKELVGLETTPVDLSPLGSQKSRGQKPRTVIGGEVSSAGRRQRGPKRDPKHGRGREKNRRKR